MPRNGKFLMPKFIPRNITDRFERALKSAPVVFISGARQVGKSTLVKEVAGSRKDSLYITFDDPNMLMAARRDSTGFLESVAGHSTVILDEVQRAPELYLPLKKLVDDQRKSGKFVLTGSTSALFLPRLADALVGRMQILILRPLSMGELDRTQETFLDWCFSSEPAPDLHSLKTVSKQALQDRIVRGGYPSAVTASTDDDADDWFDAYTQTIISRDVRDLADVDRLLEFPQLFRMLAARSGALTNLSELSRTIAIPLNTLKRYLSVLEAVCLYEPLPPWHSNLGKRLVKAPKGYLCDSGLLCHLIGLSENIFASEHFGHILENFVVCELRKQLGWSAIKGDIYHWRTHEGDEVDFVIENKSGTIVGIEIKAAATIKPNDLKGLSTLREKLGSKFKRGIILYQGKEIVPLGNKIVALPLPALWKQ